MPSPYNVTNIPAPRVPFTDERTGLISREWYRFLLNLFTLTGSGTNPTSLDELQLGPPPLTIDELNVIIANNSGDLAPQYQDMSGLYADLYSQAQLASMPSLQLGTISAQNADNVTITGGSIDNTPIGSTTRSTGAFTNLTLTNALTTTNGGTGLNSYTAGDMVYYASGTALSKLAIGSNTYILSSNGSAPVWTAPSSISIGTATNLAGGTANQIAYQTAPGTTGFIVAPTVANTYLEWSGAAFQWSSNPLGTVTSVSVVSANGFAGTVATATTTPAITLTTTITGLLKGNGTAISAATSGTDYAPATSGTSILYGNGAGGFSNVTIGTGVSFSGGTLSATGSGGTVTSVAALTLGTTGTDLSSTVANSTTTPVITLNVPTASAVNRGALSSTDWSTFNSKQAALVSGTNIKTVGGVSLLGSGDVGTIGIGYGGTGQTSFTANYVHYGSFSTSAGFQYNGTYLNAGVASYYRPWLGTVGAGVPPYGSAVILPSDSGANQKAWRILGRNIASGSGLTLEYSTTGSGYGSDPTGYSYTEAVRFYPSGGMSLGNTTDPGAGILFVSSGVRFPATQVASADANTLDDYEEGTWTPTVAAGSGSITSYSTLGAYTKVGRLVTISWYLKINDNGTGGSYLNVSGLPFTIGNYGGSTAVRSASAGGTACIIQAPNGSTTYTVWKYDNTYPVATNSQLNASFSYFV